MNTLVISEPTLVTGNSSSEIKESLTFLRDFIKSGNSLIYLTNRPSDCISPVGGTILGNGEVSFDYCAQEKIDKGLNILLRDEDVTIINELIDYSYAVFGNGALIFDELDRIIYEKYLDPYVVKEVAKLLAKNGYEDNPNPIFMDLAKLSYIKYYKSNIGVLDKEDGSGIYGLQAYSPSDMRKSTEVNGALRQVIESSNLGLRCWTLNNMPCIYNEKALKEHALKWLIENKQIDVDKMHIIVGDITDLEIATHYADLTYAVTKDPYQFNGLKKETSIARALEKVQ